MLFAFHGIDGADAPAKRTELYPQHRAHLEDAPRFGVSITMSGPLVADDGATPKGSLIVVEAPSRDAAEKFYHNDPFFKAGVWKQIDITAFKKVKG